MQSALYNPQLEGNPFFWQGGETGILLFHGLTATPAEVIPLAKFLHGQGYTVAGPLLPGHGTTPDDLNRVHWREWTDTAENSFRHLADTCRTVVVGGESTGALLALYLAARHTEIAAVLAYAPAIQLALSRWDVLKTYFFAPFIRAVPKPGLGDSGSDLWQGYPVNPLKGVIQLFKLQKVIRRMLGQVSQPLLVVEGANDKTISPDSAEIIAQYVASREIERHMMPASGHVVLLDSEREQVFAITLKFLARVLPSG